MRHANIRQTQDIYLFDRLRFIAVLDETFGVETPDHTYGKFATKKFITLTKSAGILLFRLNQNLPEVMLVHPGGPFWTNKDSGAWSIPKGEFEESENPLEAAKRELFEETGILLEGKLLELTAVKQASGKLVYAWAAAQDADAANISSNYFEMEWPPKSGLKKSFPEIDKAGWFTIDEARRKIISGQLPFLTELENIISPGI